MSGNYSTGRPAGREHVPVYPKGFIAIRIVQLVVAIIVLGLDAYTLSVIETSGNELNIFTALATMIIAIYGIVVHFHASAWKGYNYWAVLALDVFGVIFWIISFALIAAEVGPFASSAFEYTNCDGFYCTTYINYMVLPCMAAVAGLGGVECVLFVVALIIHGAAMHKHRAAGLHCAPLSSTHHSHNNGDIPMGGPGQHAGQAEKQQQVTSHAPAASTQQQQQQPPANYGPTPIPQQQQYATPTPPPQGQAPYQAPAVPITQPQQQPYYGQQQQVQQHQQVSPLGAVGQQQGGAYAAPHAGSYEAQGQAVEQGHQQY